MYVCMRVIVVCMYVCMYVCMRTSEGEYEAVVGTVRVEVVLAHVLHRSQALHRHSQAAET